MIFRAGIWAFAGKTGHQAVNILLVVILARLLTPEAFGVVAAAQVILVLSQVVVRFGIGAALIQTDALTPSMERTALTLMLGLALLVSTTIFILTPWLAQLLRVPELVEIMPIMQLTFLISAAVNPSMSLLIREMEFKLIAAIDVGVFSLVNAVVAVSLALSGWSYWALILATLAGTTAQAGIIWWLRPILPTIRIRCDELKSLLTFGGAQFLAEVGSNAAQRIDNAIVSSTFGSAALGFYSRAYTLMEVSNAVFGAAFRDVLFTAFSKFRRDSEASTNLKHMFVNAHIVAALVVLPTSSVMWAFAEEIILLLMGGQWIEAAPILKVFAIGMLFRLGYKVSGSFLLAMGKPMELAILNGCYAALVVVGAYLGSYAGIEGIAWGVTAALLIHHLLLLKRSAPIHGASMREIGLATTPFLLAAIASTSIVVLVFPSSPSSSLAIRAILTASAGFSLLVLYVIFVRMLLWKWSGYFIPSIEGFPRWFQLILRNSVAK